MNAADPRVVNRLDADDVDELCTLQRCATHDDIYRRRYSLLDAREVADGHTRGELGRQSQGRLSNDAQCAFSSNEQLGEIEACARLAGPGASLDHFSVGSNDSLENHVSDAFEQVHSAGRTRFRIHSALAVEASPQIARTVRDICKRRTCSIAHCVRARTTG